MTNMHTSTNKAAILIVDDEAGIRAFLSDALTDAGHEVAQARDATDALAQLEDRPFDVMLLDLKMPGELGGMDVLRRARASWPDLQIIVLSAHGTVGNAVEAMRMGAFDFMEKPIDTPAALRRLVARALNWRGSSARVAIPEAAVAPTRATVARGRTGRIKTFLWELKRRHVYNVAVTYAAVSFFALQAADAVLPALALPGWTYAAIVVAFLVGFPVALALGWVYDITAHGVTRTDEYSAMSKA